MLLKNEIKLQDEKTNDDTSFSIDDHKSRYKYSINFVLGDKTFNTIVDRFETSVRTVETMFSDLFFFFRFVLDSNKKSLCPVPMSFVKMGFLVTNSIGQ